MMKPQKGQTIELDIEKVAYGGRGIGRIDGFVVFLRGVAPGDRVQARVYKKKKAYAEASLVELITPSPDRVRAPCPYNGYCGGCQWQHIQYAAQLSYKKEQVEEGNLEYKYYLPLLSGNDTIELDPDQSQFTRNFTLKAVDYIKSNSKNNFFIYLPHPMPHIPIYASDSFQNSKRGDYGNTIEEIDWSVGMILKTLKEEGIADNTLVIFTSDNGPWLKYKTRGGSAGPLRDGKGTTWEGGMREPCIFWWPGTIEANNISTSLVTSMDIFPTIASIVDYDLSSQKAIDGINILDQLLTGNELSERFFYYYSAQGKIEGIRKGPWKLLKRQQDLYLFNLEEDISEKFNLAERYPDMVEELSNQLLEFDQQIEEQMRSYGKLGQ